VRRNTLTYQSLIRFLHTLGIPIVATFRDSQNYVRAAELGVGVHEMKSYVAKDDVEQWAPLVRWLTGPKPDEGLPPAQSPGGGGATVSGEAAAVADGAADGVDTPQVPPPPAVANA
jgi:hypothetical protein